MPAVDSNDEGAFAACTIMRIDIGAGQKYAVLNSHCVQFARAYAYEGKACRRLDLTGNVEALLALLRSPQ
jgi:hypothetical protein